MTPYPPKAMLYLGPLLLFVITPADAAVEANTTAEFTLEVFVPCAAGGVARHQPIASAVDQEAWRVGRPGRVAVDLN